MTIKEWCHCGLSAADLIDKCYKGEKIKKQLFKEANTHLRLTSAYWDSFLICFDSFFMCTLHLKQEKTVVGAVIFEMLRKINYILFDAPLFWD